MCAKELSDSIFHEAVIGKTSNLTNSQKKKYFFKYNWTFLDRLLLPYKFHGNSMTGILVFNFARSEPLNSEIGAPYAHEIEFSSHTHTLFSGEQNVNF